MKVKINWWGVAFLCCSMVLYAAGRLDGQEAQIRASLPTKEQTDKANKKYVEDVLKTCVVVWEESHDTK